MSRLPELPGVFVIAIVACAVFVYWPHKHVNPCTANKGECYSIQGEYSKPGCPGQHIETVDVDNHTFFLGCYE